MIFLMLYCLRRTQGWALSSFIYFSTYNDFNCCQSTAKMAAWYWRLGRSLSFVIYTPPFPPFSIEQEAILNISMGFFFCGTDFQRLPPRLLIEDYPFLLVFQLPSKNNLRSFCYGASFIHQYFFCVLHSQGVCIEKKWKSASFASAWLISPNAALKVMHLCKQSCVASKSPVSCPSLAQSIQESVLCLPRRLCAILNPRFYRNNHFHAYTFPIWSISLLFHKIHRNSQPRLGAIFNLVCVVDGLLSPFPELLLRSAATFTTFTTFYPLTVHSHQQNLTLFPSSIHR